MTDRMVRAMSERTHRPHPAPDDVLTRIDAAVEEWATSRDAMTVTGGVAAPAHDMPESFTDDGTAAVLMIVSGL